MPVPRRFLLATLLALLGLVSAAPAPPSAHSNTWAVLVGTSKYWFNYRHNANALSFYRTVKSLGIPDDRIILMLPEDTACTPRNPFPGHMFNSPSHELNLYDEDSVEVDYRGSEVTVESFLRLLTNRHAANTPSSKKLLTDDTSNVLIYLSGHGGDGFLKFQDADIMSSQDLADAIGDMHTQKRYNELFFIVDTCQAATLPALINSPNVLTLSSSALGENSFSHTTDPLVGNALIDKFTYYALEFFEKTQKSKASLGDFMRAFSRQKLQATPVARTELFSRPLNSVPVTDFFGADTVVHPLVPHSLCGTAVQASANVNTQLDVQDAAALSDHDTGAAKGANKPDLNKIISVADLLQAAASINRQSSSAAVANATTNTNPHTDKNTIDADDAKSGASTRSASTSTAATTILDPNSSESDRGQAWSTLTEREKYLVYKAALRVVQPMPGDDGDSNESNNNGSNDMTAEEAEAAAVESLLLPTVGGGSAFAGLAVTVAVAMLAMAAIYFDAAADRQGGRLVSRDNYWRKDRYINSDINASSEKISVNEVKNK